MSGMLEPVVPGPPPTNPHAVRYARSYLWLRIFVGALGLALPFLLVFVDGLAFSGDPFPRGSLSSYYYSGARELFVGGLSAIGVFLVTYRVAERNLDNTLSILAGLMVIVVALFPTTRTRDDDVELTALQELLGETTVGTVHFASAFVFILSLAVISYQFGKREAERQPHSGQRRSQRFWKLFHWACALAIVLALAFVGAMELTGWNEYSLLVGEAVSVWAFGISWLFKGLELELLRGTIPAPPPAA